ncbi:cytochrome P450 [Candidatus Poriferisocius sp.]|uniref:cytochrome P450 n=1 Tax=Candidatus Poriferisocius sp. TaxID=3101276 RepID=UPI003B022005
MTDPVQDWLTDWDHADPAWARDPFSITATLRDTCPVARTERYGGAWLVTTHELISAVVRDHEAFSSRETGVRPPGTNTKKSPPITSDPPDHGEHRRVLLPSFAPRYIAGLEDELRRYCKSLIAALPANGRFDAAGRFAQHIPTQAVAMLLDLPSADAATFRGWVRAIMVQGHADPGARHDAIAALQQYLRPLLENRRGGDGTDVLTIVASEQIDGEPLSDEMAVGMAYLLVVAGIDTTWSALGTALWHLGSHPADLARLVAEPELIPGAVEEVLRFYAPVAVGRIAANDVDFAGCPIRAGERLLLPFVSANRDPSAFDRADEFVIDRAANRHATFGLGIHRCLGSHLARLELRVALEEFIGAFPTFHVPNPEEVEWTPGHVRGPVAVPVETTGAAQ